MRMCSRYKKSVPATENSDNNIMKHLLIIMLFISILSCAGTSSVKEPDISMFIPNPAGDLPITSFREVWGYVVAGSEAPLRRGLPITDVGYFGAEVSIYGKLINVPNRQNLSAFPGRVHLTVTCGNYALTYFVLLPGSPQRKELIDDLVEATKNFDGLNIDFENIPVRAGESFLSFMRDLRQTLPADKMLTICLYGRFRANPNDVYDYARFVPYVDRIFVMAYDQHWSGSKPGPVSTLAWCHSVAEYSLRVTGADKLVMGIPFYGRAWEDHNHHRAYIYSGIQRLINTHNVKEIKREEGIPTFDYNATIGVKVYYDDAYSLSARMEMYKKMGVQAIGFWRIGQETPRVWDILRIE